MATKPAVSPVHIGRVPLNLPTDISWQRVATVRTGASAGNPVPQWALDAVAASYADHLANAEHPAFQATFEDESQARAVLHQVRRAATTLGYGISCQVNGAELTWVARPRKQVSSGK